MKNHLANTTLNSIEGLRSMIERVVLGAYYKRGMKTLQPRVATVTQSF